MPASPEQLQVQAPAGGDRVRILIDCSYVDFRKQATGIPRVVLKYVEAGYEWGAARGIDVVPVVTTADGVIPVRPLPGKSPPAATKLYLRPGTQDLGNGTATARHLRDAETALRAALVEAGAPSAVAGVDAGLGSLFSNLVTGNDGDSPRINVGPQDIMFFPAYWHDLDPKLLEDARERGAKVFILVHDVLPITFAKFYNSPWREAFANNLLAAIQNADGMLAVSNYTANGVLHFARQNGVPLERVEVLHNGFDPLVENDRIRTAIEEGRYQPPASRKKNFQFFKDRLPYLMVGTIEPKKGHVPVIQSFERFWRAGLERNLVLVGRRGWMDDEVVEHIAGSEYFGSKLFWLDDLDDVDLQVAYKNSRGLIFGSYAEGFGIPLIEAASARLPLICYDTEVAREVAGPYASFYSNLPELEHHISELENDVTHSRRKAALKDFSWPSWRETAERLFAYLESFPGESERSYSAASSHR